MQLFLNRKLMYCQFCFFSISICFSIIGKYYSLERYHSYGCRKNYGDGFPIICPLFRRPNGLDADSAMMFFASFISVILMIIFPILYETRTWKSWLLQEIHCLTENAVKSIGLGDIKYVEQTFELILFLEGLSNEHHRLYGEDIATVKKRSFLVHIGSCIWAELYLAYIFKNYKTFAVLTVLITVTILFPLFLPLADTFPSTIGLMISCILYYMLPCFSGVLIIVLASSILSTNMNLFIIIFIVLWITTSLTTLIIAYWKDKQDELHLMRNIYMKKLQSKQDVDCCLYLRGYSEYFFILLLFLYNVCACPFPVLRTYCLSSTNLSLLLICRFEISIFRSVFDRCDLCRMCSLICLLSFRFGTFVPS